MYLTGISIGIFAIASFYSFWDSKHEDILRDKLKKRPALQ
jgi:hypothetical protein